LIAQIDRRYLRTAPRRVVPRLLSYALFEGRPVTTSGRWINPLLFGLFAAAKRLPPPKAVVKPVFIVGTGRSGTTVLGVVLSMHRDVGFLNEPKALWHAIHPGEDLIGNYTRASAAYQLDESDVSEEVRTAAHRLFGTYLFVTGSRTLVDKYPELLFRAPFVKAIFPDARFLFLVRNGWDTCRSIENWSERKGRIERSEAHDWWGVDRRKWCLLIDQVAVHDPDLGGAQDDLRHLEYQHQMAAVEWLLTMRQGIAVRERYPNDVLEVRYEELTQHPERILPELSHFCGLRPDPSFLEYGREVLHPSPPREPFDLSPSIRSAFEQTMKTLGYAVEADP
jgi:hypothetical protein